MTANVNLPQEQKNKFGDTEGVIRSCKSKGQTMGQKDKQLSTEHASENERLSKANPTKNRG